MTTAEKLLNDYASGRFIRCPFCDAIHDVKTFAPDFDLDNNELILICPDCGGGISSDLVQPSCALDMFDFFDKYPPNDIFYRYDEYGDLVASVRFSVTIDGRAYTIDTAKPKGLYSETITEIIDYFYQLSPSRPRA